MNNLKFNLVRLNDLFMFYYYWEQRFEYPSGPTSGTKEWVQQS